MDAITEKIDKKWLYEHNKDKSARFVLGTTGTNPLVCFGINPSTAEPNNLDPTCKRVDRYAREHGFDSWIMLNIYPQIEKCPKDIHTVRDNALHRENIEHIANILKRQKLMLWAAWGENITKRNYLTACLKDIHVLAKQYKCRWVSLGSTVNMHPYHPLYRGKYFKLYSSPLLDFDITKYICR